MAGRKDSPTSSAVPFAHWWIDTRMIAPMRLVLAATALLVIYIDPSQPDRLVGLTYSLLLAYTAYSAVVLLISFVAPRYMPVNILHWLDLCWYVSLIAVSSGTSSIFFLFFFFAILVASFCGGFASGLRTTLASVILFVMVGYLTAHEPEFELNRFLLRAVTLLVLGYMIAHWGGSEIELKRRLQLLKDVTTLSNPRFGVGRTIRLGLERLRSFCDARACILIYRFDSKRGYELTRVDRGKAEAALPEQITDELAGFLLLPAPHVAVVRATRSSKPLLYDVENGKTWRDQSANLKAISNTLSGKTFTSAPVAYRGQFIGRLYVVDSRRRMNQSDVEFILQLIEHVSPMLDNIGLLDRLASEAADQERKKLARDIHDSVIQPYVGLQLGLAAVRQKLVAEDSAVVKEISELCEVANDEVRGLRKYLDELTTEDARYGVLFPAIRRFAAKYTAATGIELQITGEEDMQLNDRLAAEVFQMIAEALSNVRRHTSAHRAEVKVTCDERDLILNICNEITDGAAATAFRPVSLSERALALGGHTDVYADSANRTVVEIRIPL